MSIPYGVELLFQFPRAVQPFAVLDQACHQTLPVISYKYLVFIISLLHEWDHRIQVHNSEKYNSSKKNFKKMVSGDRLGKERK